MNPRQLLSIILARWWVIVLTTLIVLGGALGFGFSRKPTYLASTQVLLDLGATNPVSGPALPAAMMQAYLSTQVEILTSQKVALRVVDALGLTDSPETVAAWQKETQGRGAIRQWVADGLLRRLDVRPTRDSSVLSITATAGTAASAASIANAFGQAYVETQIEIRIAPAKQSRVWFAEQVQLLRERLDQTQRRVTDYQRAKGIFSSEERFDVESARLLELSTQMVGLSAQTGEAAKRRQLAVESLSRGVASDLPEILQNPLVQQLKANQARLEARQRELSAVYGRNHPEILKLQQELDATRTRVLQEIDTVASSISKNYSVAERRELEARTALDSQRGRVMAMKQSRDELRVLERDLENAQRAYDQSLQRLNQAGLESRSTQGNVVTLNPAVEPLKPASPNLPLNGLVGAFLGLILGFLGVLLLEFSDQRIRTLEDLENVLPGPVIGRIRVVGRRPLHLGVSPSSLT